VPLGAPVVHMERGEMSGKYVDIFAPKVAAKKAEGHKKSDLMGEIAGAFTKSVTNAQDEAIGELADAFTESVKNGTYFSKESLALVTKYNDIFAPEQAKTYTLQDEYGSAELTDSYTNISTTSAWSGVLATDSLADTTGTWTVPKFEGLLSATPLFEPTELATEVVLPHKVLKQVKGIQDKMVFECKAALMKKALEQDTPHLLHEFLVDFVEDVATMTTRIIVRGKFY
jgi:hypothetical protein